MALKDFANIKSPEELASYLRLPLGQLRFHAKNAFRYYREFKIKKRSGGERTIHAPNDPLKSIQKRLASGLSTTYKPRHSVRGFTPNQSILTNASPHVGKSLVLNLDLEDFFQSIHRGRIVGSLMAKPFELPKSTASLIADICCLGNKLPQGAPTSPVLSNIVCWNLDRDLERLAFQYRCYYTRYADDITFSASTRAFPSALLSQETAATSSPSEIEKAILKNGFRINPKKTRLLPKSRRQEVTGIVVNEFTNVDRRFIRQIRAMLHAWRKFGLDKAQAEYEKEYWAPKTLKSAPPRFDRVVLGKISFVGQVRSHSSLIYKNLISEYAKLNPGFKLPPEPAPEKDIVQLANECTWVLEAENVSQGTGFMLKGVGIVTCAHVLAPQMKAYRSTPNEIGKQHYIEVVHKDEQHDLAVVKLVDVELDQFPSFERGDSTKLKSLDSIYAIGFANYNIGNSLDIKSCQVSGFYKRSAERRIRINTGIIAGMSGGPVTTPNGSVIGIAVTGADREEDVDDSSKEHGVIPIELLAKLLKV